MGGTFYVLTAGCIGLFLFSIYLLSFSGKFHVMDELAVFTAGYNLAQHGRADIDQLIWTNHWTPNPPGVWGRDGHLYTKKPPGISFLTAPLIWLGRVLPGLNVVHMGLLTNAIVTALTASLLFIWLVDLGFSQSTASLTSLAYGLCTIAWVYARMFWESSLLALVFLTAVWASYRATTAPDYQSKQLWWLSCGLAMALSLTLRFEAIAAISFIGLYLIGDNRWQMVEHGGRNASRFTFHVSRFTFHVSRFTFHTPIRRLPLLVIYLTPIFLTGLGLLYFNFARYGSLAETGYTQEILFREPWVGAFGLLFSPGRGLFIYAPLLLLLFFGLRPAWQRLPRAYFWLIASTCLFYWLFYGSWFAWGGTWGWGPRFLLLILPLLMLFVAEVLEQAGKPASKSAQQPGSKAIEQQNDPITATPPPDSPPHPLTPSPPHPVTSSPRRILAWLGIGLLVLLSLLVNVLGIAVDFNEHFLRLGSNDNFVFNWAAFPPLAHWRILTEGLVDVIWLQPQPTGLSLVWPVLTPALILLALATFNLMAVFFGRGEDQQVGGKLQQRKDGTWPISSFILHRLPMGSSAFISTLFLAVLLTFMMMRGTAQVGLTSEQAQLDLPMLETLATSARPGDALLMPMPPFGDVQEISTRLMAYLEPPLPTFAWIESEPRAIQPIERERVWQAVLAEARRVWLFERWLSQTDPTSLTANYLSQTAFPIQTRWFERSGKLTLYALADPTQPVQPAPLNIPFQGGLTLLDFAIVGQSQTIAPGEALKLRLTWQAADNDETNVPGGAIIVFVQLLDEVKPDRNVAQQDRLLIDLQNFQQSPLLPGQTIQQGYGLLLPDDLPPGNYPLIAGLYDAATGRRLPRTDGSPDDFLYLTTVHITKS